MKKILALLLAVLMIVGLVACGESNPDEPQGSAGSTQGGNEPAEVQEVTLKVWAPQEDQVDGKGWLNEMLAKFEEAHPEYKITWDIGVCSEGDAGNNVKADPEAAGDVYFFANDQMGTLLQANALAKLGGSYLDQVKNDNSQVLLNTVTYADGNVYGFPMTNNTWFMYYNKDMFTEEDVKSLDTMLAKGKVSFPMSTAWWGGAFFMGNGGTLYGENGTDASQGIQFGGEAGYAAALKMVQIANNPNFVDDASGLGTAGLKEGTIGACFTGSWDYAALKEALGDKLGAVQPPMVEIGGKQVQMRAFAGSKCVGVNPNCKNQKVAMQLAAFLTSEEAQMARYEMRGIIPSHKNLAANETIAADMVAVAEMNTMTNCSVAQPTIPEMASYWTPMGSFGAAVVNKDVTEDNYMDMVDQFMTQLNASGL